MERRILQMPNPEMPVAPTCPCWQTPRSHRQFKVRVSGYFWVVWSKDCPMLFCASPQLLSSGLALANHWQHCSCCCRHAHGLVRTRGLPSNAVSALLLQNIGKVVHAAEGIQSKDTLQAFRSFFVHLLSFFGYQGSSTKVNVQIAEPANAGHDLLIQP